MIADPTTVPRRSVGDFWTVVAITVIAYSLASLLHEGLGHGGACLAIGAHPLGMATGYFDCSRDSRLVSAAGTIVNFAAGFFAWAMLRRLPNRSSHFGFFLWLTMAVNLMQGGGYFLYSGVGNIGDWADVIRGLSPAWAWRVGLAVLGAVLYVLIVWLAGRELLPFLPEDDKRWPTARRLSITPYLAGGIFSCIAGAFNPHGMILVAISSAAASFGGVSGLVWMPLVMARCPALFPAKAATPRPLARSSAWIIAGCVVAVLFILGLGRGVTFH